MQKVSKAIEFYFMFYEIFSKIIKTMQNLPLKKKVKNYRTFPPTELTPGYPTQNNPD